MLQASKEFIKRELEQKGEEYPNNDIVVTKTKLEENVINHNTIEMKRVEYQVNLSRKVNETAKLIKNQQAIEKLKEIEQIFTK